MVDPKPSLRDARSVLGVTAAATPAQVVTAFRHRAKAVHPDVAHAHDAAARFAVLVAAYHVALPAAHEHSDRRAGAAVADPAPVPATPAVRRSHDVVTDSGVTEVWEGSRPLLVIGPVITHGPSTRPGGEQQPGGRWHR